MNFSISIEELKVLISFSIFFATLYCILQYFNVELIVSQIIKNKKKIRSKALVYDGEIIQCFSALQNIDYDKRRGIWLFYFIYKFKDERLLNDFLNQFGIKPARLYSNIILIKTGYKRRSKTFIFQPDFDIFNKLTIVEKISFIDESYNIIKSFNPKKKRMSLLKDTMPHDIIFSTYVLTIFTIASVCKTYGQTKHISVSYKKNLDEKEKKEIEEIEKQKKEKQKEEEDIVYYLFSSLDKYKS